MKATIIDYIDYIPLKWPMQDITEMLLFIFPTDKFSTTATVYFSNWEIPTEKFTTTATTTFYNHVYNFYLTEH